jgi:hypothetical protein
MLLLTVPSTSLHTEQDCYRVSTLLCRRETAVYYYAAEVRTPSEKHGYSNLL